MAHRESNAKRITPVTTSQPKQVRWARWPQPTAERFEHDPTDETQRPCSDLLLSDQPGDGQRHSADVRVVFVLLRKDVTGNFPDGSGQKVWRHCAEKQGRRSHCGVLHTDFFNIVVDGKRVRGIFSGDTIIDPAYWGNNALVTTFYRRLIIERFKHPFTPFYWFLISKGYKTYLLLTNNFYKYYPSVSWESQRLKRITQAYCEQLFPGDFDADRMLLDFGDSYVRLKDSVARITPELASIDKDIGFFEQINPTWERGTEVPCIGTFDYYTLVRSMFDVPWKWMKKRVLGTHHRPGTELDPALAGGHRLKRQLVSNPESTALSSWLDDDDASLSQGGAS